jgi:MFS family permease
MTEREQRPAMLRLLLSSLSPKTIFLLTSLSLGELGDGLNIFQGVYLVGLGWNEGSVGFALALMGITALIIQPMAGDFVDKTTIDRRMFLAAAAVLTALSASSILIVRQGNTDHMLIFLTKIVEGVAASFIGPCLAALTLATFGPHHFDRIMASNIMWVRYTYCEARTMQSKRVLTQYLLSFAFRRGTLVPSWRLF